MLRTATSEDEWLLLLHGAVLGLRRRPDPSGDLWMSDEYGARRRPPRRRRGADRRASRAGSPRARGCGRGWASWSLGASVRGRAARPSIREPPRRSSRRSPRLRNYARELLGITISTTASAADARRARRTTRGRERVSDGELLRAQGDELLRQSADVNFEDRGAPRLRADPDRARAR